MYIYIYMCMYTHQINIKNVYIGIGPVTSRRVGLLSAWGICDCDDSRLHLSQYEGDRFKLWTFVSLHITLMHVVTRPVSHRHVYANSLRATKHTMRKDTPFIPHVRLPAKLGAIAVVANGTNSMGNRKLHVDEIQQRSSGLVSRVLGLGVQ